MIIDASKMNATGYNEGSAIGAAVQAFNITDGVSSFSVELMIADSDRVIDFYTTKELLIVAAKECGVNVKIETVNDNAGWSRRLVVHYL